MALFDFVYLHRDNPAVRPFFEWQTSGRIAARPPARDRHRAAGGHGDAARGRGAGDLARFWLTRQPENAVVFSDGTGQPAGFLLLLALEQATAQT